MLYWIAVSCCCCNFDRGQRVFSCCDRHVALLAACQCYQPLLYVDDPSCENRPASGYFSDLKHDFKLLDEQKFRVWSALSRWPWAAYGWKRMMKAQPVDSATSSTLPEFIIIWRPDTVYEMRRVVPRKVLRYENRFWKFDVGKSYRVYTM